MWSVFRLTHAVTKTQNDTQSYLYSIDSHVIHFNLLSVMVTAQIGVPGSRFENLEQNDTIKTIAVCLRAEKSVPEIWNNKKGMKFSILILSAYCYTSQSHRHALGYLLLYLYLHSVALLAKCPYANKVNNAFVSLLDFMICSLLVNTAIWIKSFTVYFWSFRLTILSWESVCDRILTKHTVSLVLT